ncbi:MAG: hypothetical protein ABI181_07840 [Mycobacteriaceae bacterium]
MGLFNIMFPKQAAQLTLNSRRVSALMAGSGLDDESNPALAGVIAELRAGRDIKATQLYCEAMGVGVVESQVAVQELKGQLRV